MAAENDRESRVASLASRFLPAVVLLVLVRLVLASWWIWAWILDDDLAFPSIWAKALLFVELALVAGIFLAARRRWEERGGAAVPPRFRALLADAAVLAGLLSFSLVFPLFDLISLSGHGQLSWGLGAALVGSPVAVLLALQIRRHALSRRELGCLIFSLSLLLCPVVGVILVLLGLLFSAFDLPAVMDADWANLGLLAGVVAVCGLLLFLGAKRLGRRQNGQAGADEE